MNYIARTANILAAITLILPVVHQALLHVAQFVIDTAREVTERWQKGMNQPGTFK